MFPAVKRKLTRYEDLLKIEEKTTEADILLDSYVLKLERSGRTEEGS